MKLMVPVNSLESCIAQVDAGADEIYVGYRVDIFKRLSFSARPQTHNMPTKDEFREIVQYAKNKRIGVKFTANTSFFSDYPVEGIDIENEYIKYVKYAVECGVDAIIISDIGLIYLIHQLGLSVPIYASTLIDIDNTYQIDFLKGIGVSRVVLAYQTTFGELECLVKDKKVEVEIFCYGGCSFGCNCMLGHNEEYGIPCKNKYTTDEDANASQKIYSVLECALCSIWKLININVDSIKLTGRGRDYKKVLPVTRLFRNAIDIALQTQCQDDFIEKLQIIIPESWKKLYCDSLSCKFEDIPNDKKSISCLGGNINV